MSLVDDEFDLDLRLSPVTREQPSMGRGPNVMMQDEDEEPETLAAVTCDVHCGETELGCPTHGCNTDTCDQVQCSDAITFGEYCEDASGGEDTCHGCPSPGGEPPDSPDAPDSPPLPSPNP